MLPRTLQRSLRQLHPPKPPTTCLTCTCRCGTPILPILPQQTRSYARKAPSTLDRKYARQDRAAALRNTSQPPSHTTWFTSRLAFLHRAGSLTCSPKSALAFIEAFNSALNSTRGQNALPPEKFLLLLVEHSVSAEDAETLSRTLLQADSTEGRYRGKKLLYTLSRAGYAEASIRVMAHAMLESKRRPAVLKSREIAISREHLTRIAKEPSSQNFRAMVLEGKIALVLGNEEYAIEMWRKAMDAAVAHSENMIGRKEVGLKDPLELTAPWHELTLLHAHRARRAGMEHEMDECEKAMRIGCLQDDPLSHYFAANYCKKFGEQGEHLGTSEWLYHISKAAASGLCQAQHELGCFYAESGWKYIEDEPPDHVKPTAFDSYPAAAGKGFLLDLLHLLGLKTKKLSPQERMFYSAHFPSTATSRLKIAVGWLETAAKLNYAPSCMMLARLYNRKTLWGLADAPKSALQLRNSRYSYASKADYDNNRPLPRRPTPEQEDPPNPLYSPPLSQSWLVEVFGAYEAHLQGEKVERGYRERRALGTMQKLADEDELFDEDFMVRRGGLREELGKWFKFPEVREMNGEVIGGLWEEAKGMVEEEGWVLREKGGGGLVWRAMGR